MRRSKEEAAVKRVKQNSVSILRFNVGLGSKIKIVEMVKPFNFVAAGEWTVADMRALGHELKKIRIKDRGTTEARTPLKTIKMNDSQNVVLVGGVTQSMHFGTIIVKKDGDYDDVFTNLAADENDVVRNGIQLTVDTMETWKANGDRFNWKSVAIGTTEDGKALEKKLILTHYNGKLLCDLPDKTKKDILAIVGLVAIQGLCNINESTVSSVDCGGYDYN